MKSFMIALSLFLSLASMSEAALAKGCVKGAAVGGVAGHVAGKHGLIGAAGGCAIGHHRAAKKEKEQQAAQANAGSAGSSANQSASAPAPAHK